MTYANAVITTKKINLYTLDEYAKNAGHKIMIREMKIRDRLLFIRRAVNRASVECVGDTKCHRL